MSGSEELLKERTARFERAISLEPNDRIPVISSFSFFAAKYAGYTPAEVMFDAQKMKEAWIKTHIDFNIDAYSNPFGLHFTGSILTLLDYKQLKIPGRGIDPNHTYQFVEGEYMKASEYDNFLFDPTDFVIRTYWPRVFGAFEPAGKFPPLYEILNYVMGLDNLVMFDEEGLTSMLKTIVEAKKFLQQRSAISVEYIKEMEGMGYPAQYSAFSQAPFDTIADYFRGMRGSLIDMYRYPDKILAACEKMLPLMLNFGKRAKTRSSPRVFIPIHKGLDSFMSLAQFQTFFWPTLQKLIIGLIEEGLTPHVFWEGDCTSRLETIAEIPRGKAIYAFEKTDIFKAKEILGNQVCIRGNVPASMLCTGSPQEVRDYCKKLIDVVGKGGGFIMDGANSLDEEKPENVKAMIDFTREYGVYN